MTDDWKPTRALCAVCQKIVPVMVATFAALKGKLVTADHPSKYVPGESCLGIERPVFKIDEVTFDSDGRTVVFKRRNT